MCPKGDNMSLSNLIELSQRILSSTGVKDGQFASPMPGLVLLQSKESPKSTAMIYDPVICLIIQGCKEVVFGDNETICVEAGQSIIVSHSTPVSSRIVKANAKNPYLAIIFGIEIKALQLLYHEINYNKTHEGSVQALKVGQTDDSLADALKRYLELSEKPQEAHILAPLIRKEIYFRLLMASHGSTLRQLIINDSHAFQIMKATVYIKENFDKALAMPEVASITGMSLPSFYNHFKSITGLSPLQYQKELRLTRAQQLLKEQVLSVTSVAFEVGYESPTQFSREFTRKFGVTPKNIQ
jgi:AraC-like DNA-binding protein